MNFKLLIDDVIEHSKSIYFSGIKKTKDTSVIANVLPSVSAKGPINTETYNISNISSFLSVNDNGSGKYDKI